jgi:hypothetical protein
MVAYGGVWNVHYFRTPNMRFLWGLLRSIASSNGERESKEKYVPAAIGSVPFAAERRRQRKETWLVWWAILKLSKTG